MEKSKKLFPNARFASIEDVPIHFTRVMPEEFAEAILDVSGERSPV